jgi:hypothetical protein
MHSSRFFRPNPGNSRGDLMEMIKLQLEPLEVGGLGLLEAASLTGGRFAVLRSSGGHCLRR